LFGVASFNNTANIAVSEEELRGIMENKSSITSKASAAKVVGFCGRMGHGKDTAAAALTSLGYTRIALAEPIREALLLMDPIVTARQTHNGITDDKSFKVTWLNRLSKLVEAYGWDEAKKSEDVRHHMQVLGTEFGREMAPRYQTVTYGGMSVWLRLALDKIESLRSFCAVTELPEPRFVITDVRFEDEAKFIKGLGGLLIHVYRPNYSTSAASTSSSHASESMTVSRMADMEIVNSGTVEDLHAMVKQSLGIFDEPCGSHCGADCNVESRGNDWEVSV